MSSMTCHRRCSRRNRACAAPWLQIPKAALPGRCIDTPEGAVGSATGGQGPHPWPCVTLRATHSSGSQEQVTSLEDMGEAQQLLAVPQQRRRTASELLKSRWMWGQRGLGTAVGQGWGAAGGAHPSPASHRRLCVCELEESEQFYQSHNRFLKLLLAGYRWVTAHSQLLCYFVIILNNMVTASILSLILPIFIFLWAMLSIPRPSKRFWMTAIVFTEVGRGWPAKG